MGRRRIIRDTDDEPQEQEEAEEKSNDSLRGWMRSTGKTGGGRERVRR